MRLVEVVRRGGPAAAELLVERYGALVHRVASLLLADHRDARDVTQCVLLIAVQQITTFVSDAALSRWMYRVTISAVDGRSRSEPSRTAAPAEVGLTAFDREGRHRHAVVDWSSRIEDPLTAAEALSTVRRGLLRLPLEDRALVVLGDVEGLGSEDVAAVLGLTEVTVRSRLHRARLALREELAMFFGAMGPATPPLRDVAAHLDRRGAGRMGHRAPAQRDAMGGR